MIDDAREPASSLRGRLADVYVPAFVSGSVEALSRRLGDKATVVDPTFGRAAGAQALAGLLARSSDLFAGATYRAIGTTTSLDRDVAEGTLVWPGTPGRVVPIVVLAERRRLREIELRLYYAPPIEPERAPTNPAEVEDLPRRSSWAPRPPFLDALVRGDVEGVLPLFEERGAAIDVRGREHPRDTGELARFLASFRDRAIVVFGTAEDARTSCIELAVEPTESIDERRLLLAIERGDSGRIRQLRVYGSEL